MTITEPGVSSEEKRVVDLIDDLLSSFPPDKTDSKVSLGEQFDRGLAWVHFPEGDGRPEAPPKLQKIIQERISAAGGPNPYYRNPIGYGMCGPTVVVWGSEEQKTRYLRPLFTGEEIWCQLFSEPGAGSDVAGLSTRAERDGEEWQLNGQKVWTTLAHVSSFGLLIARTNPDAPKHKGMTYFVVDMKAPGVEVRPLVQITGEAEFNEVYFTDVRIPDAARLGAEGDGGRRAVTTLMNERASMGGAVGRRGGGPVAEAMRIWKERW